MERRRGETEGREEGEEKGKRKREGTNEILSHCFCNVQGLIELERSVNRVCTKQLKEPP